MFMQPVSKKRKPQTSSSANTTVGTSRELVCMGTFEWYSFDNGCEGAEVLGACSRYCHDPFTHIRSGISGLGRYTLTDTQVTKFWLGEYKSSYSDIGRGKVDQGG